MKIRTKLTISFMFIALIGGMIGTMGGYFVRYIEKKSDIITLELSPHVEALAETKFFITEAFLILEEIIAGESNDIDLVYKYLDEGLWYANAIINGGKNEKLAILKSENEEILNEIEHIIVEIADFRKIAEQIY